MNNRPTITIILAVVLILAVMSCTALMTFSSGFELARYDETEVWSQPFADIRSMKIIDLTGDKQDDLFVQNSGTVAMYEADGQQRWTQDFPAPIETTLGDVSGDGVEDIVVFAADRSVTAIDGVGKVLWDAPVANVGQPARVAVARFGGGTQVIVGDMDGLLVGLRSDGGELWRANLSSGDYIRGLDTATVGGTLYIVAANHDGTVAMYDADGKQRWSYSYSGALRRMRTYDLDGDGNGEVLLGGDAGNLVVLAAGEGEQRANASLGQAITEIREAELDGDPSTRELAVGGKDGGVWAYRASGEQLWSANLSERVNELVALDVDDDGADEVLVGDEGGGVTLLTGRDGRRHQIELRTSPIARLDAGKLTGSDQLVVADGGGARLLALDKQPAPFWYTPLLAGMLISALIAGAAWFITTIPPKPVLRAAVEDQSVEGIQSRRRMLHENLADVERLRKAGEMAPEAYLARLRDLRGELADTDAALQRAGVPVQVATFKCPNCAGTLPLGMDRCDYCGQVVIA